MSYFRYYFIFLMILGLFIFIQPNVSADFEQDFQLNSEVALLMDQKSGDIIYNQDINQKMYPASITKIVTGIIAIEQGNLDDIVTVSKGATEVIGTRVYLLEGEEVSLKKLVQGLLINSGNDAGTAIAEYFDGSEKAFSERMNQFLQDIIGDNHTNFTNPHGLYDEDHYTTALDMAKITSYALQNETFREIVETKELDWIGEGWETTIHNHHRLLWDYEGTTGVKNGFVQNAGYTLVTSAQRNDLDLIAVTLNAPNAQLAYKDTMSLLDYGFDHFETNQVHGNNKFLGPNGHEFILNQDVYFTQLLNETVEFQVNPDHKLEIIGTENRMIKEVPLHELKVEPVQTKAELEKKHEATETEASGFFLQLWNHIKGWLF
ncbi:D-alanyl-D-alanine carboxypeptidase family protein [Alkalihalobacillus trypoxylicola]|uniref:D-alanyl-D-alanine carboxypeptidase n=1 Tax=Alkalihalobacillus trypoxylicola TaxID=519424 RepID=A0A162EEN2_9BACI|nr:D-alanyl-D-alanine carboxypeptidase family protein [Alkalihalobacillus trypoxylicola]KYG32395.1 D-alanyl-D-alanine carboxypeptidase [Alkalihalobacillus trypoxylicola]